jgi:2-phospho-L-lactate guanylyltransferase
MTPFRAILLPVKDLTGAKQRLAVILTVEERFALANAMLADTMHGIAEASHASAVFVVTNYSPAIAAAESRGWEVLRETHQVSESASVDFASTLCAERGVTHLLRVPLDVPRVRGEDLDALLDVDCGERGAVLVPSRDGTGTNAILRSPPALFPSHFGPGSFALHCEEACNCGARIEIRKMPNLETDIDDETDLRAYLALLRCDTQTDRLLDSLGIAGRLARFFAANSAHICSQKATIKEDRATAQITAAGSAANRR